MPAKPDRSPASFDALLISEWKNHQHGPDQRRPHWATLPTHRGRRVAVDFGTGIHPRNLENQFFFQPRPNQIGPIVTWATAALAGWRRTNIGRMWSRFQHVFGRLAKSANGRFSRVAGDHDRFSRTEIRGDHIDLNKTGSASEMAGFWPFFVSDTRP